MLKDLNYVSFDFETTGLDLKKDEPIQFWLVKFDKDFNVIAKYSTYIKPKKNISELKNIVSFITWLNLKDLKNAPYFEEVIPEIKKFFDEKTVLVWQNIEFDYDFLKKYWADFKPLELIDTFVIAKTIFHFFPSYSLEVLFDFVKDELGIDISEWGHAHDALVDSLMSMYVFRYSIEYLEKLFSKYPILLRFILKSDSFFNTIIDFSKFEIPSNINIFLPRFKKEIPPSRKVFIDKTWDIDSIKNFWQIRLSQWKIVEFVKNVVSLQRPVILSVSNKWKLEIIDKILESIGYTNKWFVSQDIIFSEDKVEKFLTKSRFEDYEINFLIKYFSHIYQGLSRLDINSFEEYKVFKFLTEKKEKKLPQIVLTTHGGLFSSIDKNINLRDYILLFLDWDWWYVSYSKYINVSLDLYDFLNKLEIILYQLKFLESGDVVLDFERLINQFMIFMGVLFMELTNKFKGINTNKLEIGPILEDIDFWRTKKMYGILKKQFNEVSKKLIKYDEFIQDLNNILLSLEEILKKLILVEKRMFQENKFYYIFHKQNEVINYGRFLNFLKGKFKKVIFWKL